MSMNWADANEVLIELLQNAGVPPSRRTIGRIRYVGSGLSNIVFGAEVEYPAGRKQAVVVKLPSDDANDGRDRSLRSEAALLGYLCNQRLPFRVPRPIAEMKTAMGLGVIQEWVDGIPVDLRRFRGGKPWELVAQVAAAVHAIDPAPMRDWLPGYPTWQDHALGFASPLQDLEEPEAEDTRAWVREHLPAPIASCLLHGDLLGQNLRRRWDPEGIAVIDWAEARVGDPAFDLAIVTRGARKPFGTPDGLQRLLEAYNALAPAPLSTRQVQLYELILVAGFYVAVVGNYGKGSPHAEDQRRAWQSVLRRASSVDRE
jgi:aminoglycoside phosphotransferase (APT) family kinase protein